MLWFLLYCKNIIRFTTKANPKMFFNKVSQNQLFIYTSYHEK